jgi:hypothetical protein
MLKAIAEDNDLSETTLQHIKSNTECVLVPEVKIGSEPDVEHPGSSHFTVAATRRICFWMEARKSFGRRSACSSDFQPAAVFCAVSTAIFQSGLAGILVLSAKRRIWSWVISERLRLSPKLRPSLYVC